MTLSIVIPTLNEASGIERLLAQIKNKLTEIDYELIVTDDGSTDGTVGIAKRYAKVISEPNPNRTIGTNRNKGARHAKGEFLVFIDADMFVPEPNHFFKVLLDEFRRDPQLLAQTVNIKVYPDEATRADDLFLGISNLTMRFMNNALRIGASSGEFQIVRRSAFEQVGGFREHLVVAEDQDLFRRLAKIGHTRFEHGLEAWNDGRRPHTVGWLRLFAQWIRNSISLSFWGRSYDKTWHEVRYWKMSFVIPAYNEEHYLADCLKAIMRQKEKTSYEIEVIVVNNASTDRTREVAKGFAGVKVVDEPKKGIVYARRAGFLAATGDLIANIDSDSRLTPGWINKVVQAFARDEKLVAISGPFIYYDAPRSVRMVTRMFYGIGYLFYFINRFILHTGSMLQGGNFVVKKTAIDAIGGYDTSISFYGEDTDLARRLNKIGRVRFTFNLPMYSSSRRLAKEGAFTIGLRYAMNYFWTTFFGRPFTHAYIDIRPGESKRGASLSFTPNEGWKEWVIGVTALVLFVAIIIGLAYAIYYFA